MNEAKRRAQEALFTAIAEQAETNMKSALKSAEKAALLLDLAEAYRLTAGMSTAPRGWPRRTARTTDEADDKAAMPAR